ncbi:MAG: EAL domain-containing protein [Actinomycetota bacterium]|nr:EAL domain-containing protein [Actinomycetota bacterium]
MVKNPISGSSDVPTSESARARRITYGLMALVAVFGVGAAAAQVFVPGEKSTYALYSSAAVTIAVIFASVKQRKPRMVLPWRLMACGVGSVAVGAVAERMVLPHLAVRPNLYLIPGFFWIGSYILYSVAANVFTFKQWGKRVNGAFILDGLLVFVAVMVPTVELVVRPILEVTPGPAVFRFLTATFLLLDGVITFCFAQMILNGRRRNPSMWFYVLATGTVVVFDFTVVLLRATVETKYAAGGWIIAWMFVALAALDPRMADLTEYHPQEEVRLDPFRASILALALMSVPMTLVLRVAQGGAVGVPMMLAGAAAVAVLVLLRLTWLFRDREKAQLEIESQERHFRALVRNIDDVISVVDADGRVHYTSPSAERLFGFSVEELTGSNGLAFIDESESEKADVLLRSALTQPDELVKGEVHAHHRDGSSRWLEITVQNLLDDPDVQNLVVSCHDVTERRMLEEQLRYEAHHDALTGMPNRALAVDKLERLLRRAAVGGRQLGVLFADLDNFKTINDTLGHAAGDQLLRGFTQRLVAAVRPNDMVARLGGDEFLILLDGTTRREAERVAERVIDAMGEPFLLEGREVWVTTSMGVALGGMDETGDELLRDADFALYRAKAAGRNMYAVYDPSIDKGVDSAIDLVHDLRSALVAGNQLFVAFQPMMDMDSGRIRGVEALVRWNHPKRGLLMPDSFIGMAEDNGLIVPLGKWVLEDACRQVAALGDDELELAVNVSARQLEDDDLPDKVVAALHASGLAPGRLTLEITESVLLERGGLDMLIRLRSIGVHLAVDDFGTGYSSLSYLRQLPVDTIKVDRQFVSAIAEDEQAAALMKGVLGLASAVGARTVAEGVENQEQADRLQIDGCRYAQGFLYARPGPLLDVMAEVAGRHVRL